MSTPDAPQQLKSAYTGLDKATIENHLKFVSARHKQNGQQFSVGDLSRRTASSVDSINEYNDVYSIAPLMSGVDTV